MFVSFLLPYHARYSNALYLWIFYKQMNHFHKDQIVYIGNKDYFVSPTILQREHFDKQEFTEKQQHFLAYTIPTDEQIEMASKYIIDTSIFDELQEKLHTNHNVYRFLLTERYEKLEIEFHNILSKIIRDYGSVKGILNWCNIPSIKYIADKEDIPVIHNEIGPLRRPIYHQTAYFDFAGVNGNTEAVQRYRKFVKEKENLKFPILARDQLVTLFYLKNEKLDSLISDDKFDIGIPLQVEDDSNLLAFSNGWGNLELIQYAKNVSKNILIRRHPGGYLDYHGLGQEDTSSLSIEYINKCEKILTINSSIALEAVLLGKDVQVLGESPFKLINCIKKDSEEMIQRLNFILFGYLIPYELLFNYEYYCWRLSHPKEFDIYMYHYNYWINKEKLTDINDENLIYKKTTNKMHTLSRKDHIDGYLLLRIKGDFEAIYKINNLCKKETNFIWEPINEKRYKVKIIDIKSDDESIQIFPQGRWAFDNDYDYFVTSFPKYIIHGNFEQSNFIKINAEFKKLNDTEIEYLNDTLRFDTIYTILTNLIQSIQGKKIIIFGTGSFSQKIKKYFPEIDYYVDNNANSWGHTIDGITIYPPSFLIDDDKNKICIIIASQYDIEITMQLIEMNFEPQRHFWNGYELFSKWL